MYGAPNGAGRCSMTQCYAKAWATLAQSKITWAMQYWMLAAINVIAITHGGAK